MKAINTRGNSYSRKHVSYDSCSTCRVLNSGILVWMIQELGIYQLKSITSWTYQVKRKYITVVPPNSRLIGSNKKTGIRKSGN